MTTNKVSVCITYGVLPSTYRSFASNCIWPDGSEDLELQHLLSTLRVISPIDDKKGECMINC